MPRPCQRVCLQSGLKLDLNQLARRGLIRLGGYRSGSISWRDNYTGEQIALGTISANITDADQGLFHIQIGSLGQWIKLVSFPRHFGGRQWFFTCPDTHRLASVLWMPPGAHHFACRQAWGRQVAYASQFSTPLDRAHQGKARINSRLCSIGGFDPAAWEISPKPKWMRWATYNRARDKFDRYEARLNEELGAVLGRQMGPWLMTK
jgi:hypothetical protein